MTEYVIRGNPAVLKCSIPSFVADFVYVDAWIDETGEELIPSNKYGLKQFHILLLFYHVF